MNNNSNFNMDEGYEYMLDELLDGILDVPEETIQQQNTLSMEEMFNRLEGVRASVDGGHYDDGTRPYEDAPELHNTTEPSNETVNADEEGSYRYLYSVSVTDETGVQSGILDGNIDWLQDRLGASGAGKFVYDTLEPVRQQRILTTNHVDLDSTACVDLNHKIGLLRRGVENGVSMASLISVVESTGWDTLEERVEQRVHAVETGQVEEEGTTVVPVRRVRRASAGSTNRGNDYELAWDIYSLGYSTGDVAHLYSTSAGSISRGIKKDGHVMRTGAETKAMRKTQPDDFSLVMIDRIEALLADKYETEEERNGAFYRAFNTNMYEMTMYEAEDEQEEIEQMHQQATTQGISLSDLARQQLHEQAYVERECSEFVTNVRELHELVTDYAKNLFGDVNVGVGAVTVQTKLGYENGVILTVKDAYKIDGKALDVKNAVVSVTVAEYVANTQERALEELAQNFDRVTRRNFTKNGAPIGISQLGNRMVVGLDNE